MEIALGHAQPQDGPSRLPSKAQRLAASHASPAPSLPASQPRTPVIKLSSSASAPVLPPRHAPSPAPLRPLAHGAAAAAPSPGPSLKPTASAASLHATRRSLPHVSPPRRREYPANLSPWDVKERMGTPRSSQPSAQRFELRSISKSITELSLTPEDVERMYPRKEISRAHILNSLFGRELDDGPLPGGEGAAGDAITARGLKTRRESSVAGGHDDQQAAAAAAAAAAAGFGDALSDAALAAKARAARKAVAAALAALGLDPRVHPASILIPAKDYQSEELLKSAAAFRRQLTTTKAALAAAEAAEAAGRGEQGNGRGGARFSKGVPPLKPAGGGGMVSLQLPLKSARRASGAADGLRTARHGNRRGSLEGGLRTGRRSSQEAGGLRTARRPGLDKARSFRAKSFKRAGPEGREGEGEDPRRAGHSPFWEASFTAYKEALYARLVPEVMEELGLKASTAGRPLNRAPAPRAHRASVTRGAGGADAARLPPVSALDTPHLLASAARSMREREWQRAAGKSFLALERNPDSAAGDRSFTASLAHLRRDRYFFLPPAKEREEIPDFDTVDWRTRKYLSENDVRLVSEEDLEQEAGGGVDEDAVALDADFQRMQIRDLLKATDEQMALIIRNDLKLEMRRYYRALRRIFDFYAKLDRGVTNAAAKRPKSPEQPTPPSTAAASLRALASAGSLGLGPAGERGELLSRGTTPGAAGPLVGAASVKTLPPGSAGGLSSAKSGTPGSAGGLGPTLPPAKSTKGGKAGEDIFVMNKKEFSIFVQETRVIGGGLSRAACDLIFIIGNRDQAESGRFIATTKHKKFQFFQFLQCVVRMAFLRYPNLPALRDRFRTMMEQLLMPNARMDADALVFRKAMGSAEVQGALAPYRGALREVYRRWAHLEYVDLEQRAPGRFGVRMRQERWRMTFAEFYTFAFMHDLAPDEEGPEAAIPEAGEDRTHRMPLDAMSRAGSAKSVRRAGRQLQRRELLELFVASLPEGSLDLEMERLGAAEGLHDAAHQLPFREFEEALARVAMLRYCAVPNEFAQPERIAEHWPLLMRHMRVRRQAGEGEEPPFSDDDDDLSGDGDGDGEGDGSGEEGGSGEGGSQAEEEILSEGEDEGAY